MDDLEDSSNKREWVDSLPDMNNFKEVYKIEGKNGKKPKMILRNDQWEYKIPKKNYERASAFVDASFGRRYTASLLDLGPDNDNQKVFVYYKFYQNMYHFRLFLSIFLFLLSFFERPSWCYHSNCNYPRDKSQIMANTDPLMWFSGFPFMGVNLGLILELVCLILIWFCTTFLGILISGFRLFRNKWAILHTVFIIISIVDIIVSFSTDRTWRLSQFLRPGILILESNRVKNVFVSVLKTLPRLGEIFAVIGITIFIFSWIGLVLWFDVPNQTNYDTIRNSLSSTQIMLTTVNYPDVMIPFYSGSFWSIIFFISFFVVGYYFLFSLILAVTFQSFKISLRKDKERLETLKKKCLVIAFKYLDINKSGYINFPIVKNLLLELKKYNRVNVPKEKNFKHFYFLMSSKSSNDVNLRQFSRLAEILKVVFISKHKPSMHRFKIFDSKGCNLFMRIVKSPYFDYFFYIVIFVNLILVIIETARFLSGEPYLKVFDVIELTITCSYVIEVMSRILAYGWAKYMRESSNQIDFLIVISCLGLEVTFSTLIPDVQNIRLLIFSRLFRLVRLLYQINTYRFLFFSIYKTFRTLGQISMIFLINMYFFAFVGIMAFGGLLFEGNALLQGGAYAANNYFSYNFNDFPNAMVTLFNVQILNNWPNTFDGLERVTSGYARFFFIFFWLTTIVIVLNVLIAFIIKVFVPFWLKMKEGRKKHQKIFYSKDNYESEFDQFTFTTLNDMYDADFDN